MFVDGGGNNVSMVSGIGCCVVILSMEENVGNDGEIVGLGGKSSIEFIQDRVFHYIDSKLFDVNSNKMIILLGLHL